MEIDRYIVHMCSHRHLDRGGITAEIYGGSPPEMCQNVRVVKMVVWQTRCQTLWCCLTFSAAQGQENRWLTFQIVVWDLLKGLLEEVGVWFDFSRGVNDSNTTSCKLYDL